MTGAVMLKCVPAAGNMGVSIAPRSEGIGETTGVGE
jgi:hypothetical protein